MTVFPEDVDLENLEEKIDKQDPVRDPMSDAIVKGIFLGTQIQMKPSGKLHTPWTTNQTAQEMEDDDKWWEAWKEALEDDIQIRTGRSDPNDIILEKRVGEYFENEDGEMIEEYY